MRVRAVLTGLIAIAVSFLAVTPTAAFGSTGPGTPIWTPTPVAPIVHRGYPCIYLVGGPFDQYLVVYGQTSQTRTGAADVYSASTGRLIWHRGLSNGSVTIHTSRGQNVAWYRAKINGITCGPGPVD